MFFQQNFLKIIFIYSLLFSFFTQPMNNQTINDEAKKTCSYCAFVFSSQQKRNYHELRVCTSNPNSSPETYHACPYCEKKVIHLSRHLNSLKHKDLTPEQKMIGKTTKPPRTAKTRKTHLFIESEKYPEEYCRDQFYDHLLTLVDKLPITTFPPRLNQKHQEFNIDEFLIDTDELDSLFKE